MIWLPLLVPLLFTFIRSRVDRRLTRHRFYQYYSSNAQTHNGPGALNTSYPGLQHRDVKEYLDDHSLESLATAMFTVGMKN